MAADGAVAVAATVEANNEMREANQITRQMMQVDHRAWITVDIELLSGFRLEDNKWRVSLAVKMTNVGKTPALNAFADPVLNFVTEGGDFKSEMLAAHAKIIRSLESFPLRCHIFPQETISRTHDIMFWGHPKNVYDRWVAQKGHILENFAPFVTVVAQYQTIFSGDGEPQHQTAMILDIVNRFDRKDWGRTFLFSEGSIPAERIMLGRPLIGAGHID